MKKETEEKVLKLFEENEIKASEKSDVKLIQNKPAGEKVRIPGLPFDVEVVSERQCLDQNVIRMALTKKEYDISIARGAVFIEGTKWGYFCNVCGEEIVLAPSGQRLEAMGGHYTCMNCILKMKEEKEHN